MSRTNPFKIKRRRANKTLLIFGEGLGEEIFLKHLKSIYACDCNVAITIKKGKGGDVKSIVVDASKIPGAFDRKIVVLDNDKSVEEMKKARQEANHKVSYQYSCLEFPSLIPGNPLAKRYLFCLAMTECVRSYK